MVNAVNTPEHAAAALEVRVADALQPLRDAAEQSEAGARELREAAESGDLAAASRLGTDLLAEHVRFGLVFRRFLAARPDLPGWRPAATAPQPPASPGADRDDRMSV